MTDTFCIFPPQPSLDKINRLRRLVDNYKVDVDKALVEYLKAWKEATYARFTNNTIKTQLLTVAMPPVVKGTLRRGQGLRTRKLNDLERTWFSKSREYFQCLSRLGTAKRAFEVEMQAANAKFPEFTLAQLTEEFSGLGLKFKLYAAEKSLEVIVPAGLKAKLLMLDGMYGRYAVTGGDELKLPAIRITIPLAGYHTVILTPVNVDDSYDNGYSGDAIHPHCMDDNTPCFGDFESAVQEAFATGDIPLIILLTLEFLQQINCEDRAGQSWPGYFLPRGKEYNWDHDHFFVDLEKGTASCRHYDPDYDEHFEEDEFEYCEGDS